MMPHALDSGHRGVIFAGVCPAWFHSCFDPTPLFYALFLPLEMELCILCHYRMEAFLSFVTQLAMAQTKATGNIDIHVILVLINFFLSKYLASICLKQGFFKVIT
jgi:hypothetical protein